MKNITKFSLLMTLITCVVHGSGRSDYYTGLSRDTLSYKIWQEIQAQHRDPKAGEKTKSITTPSHSQAPQSSNSSNTNTRDYTKTPAAQPAATATVTLSSPATGTFVPTDLDQKNDDAAKKEAAARNKNLPRHQSPASPLLSLVHATSIAPAGNAKAIAPAPAPDSPRTALAKEIQREVAKLRELNAQATIPASKPIAIAKAVTVAQESCQLSCAATTLRTSIKKQSAGTTKPVPSATSDSPRAAQVNVVLHNITELIELNDKAKPTADSTIISQTVETVAKAASHLAQTTMELLKIGKPKDT